MKYCSQCYWSSNDPAKFPPYWYCVLHKCAPIVRDEDASECVDYLDIRDKLKVQTNSEEQTCIND